VKVLVHVYECEDCDVLFSVSQAFEEHHLLQCPMCKTDKAIRELSSGELYIKTNDLIQLGELKKTEKEGREAPCKTF
jgi:putative FmdB family regulatory protein